MPPALRSIHDQPFRVLRGLEGFLSDSLLPAARLYQIITARRSTRLGTGG
jgi:hypothetical protein